MKPITENETHVPSDRSPEPYTEARGKYNGRSSVPTPRKDSGISVALLTAGIDKHYTYGLAAGLGSRGAVIDLIGSDELDGPELRSIPRLNFLNLRGHQRHDANILVKVFRILRYYVRLIRYAGRSKAQVFHILWNNRFQTFDRTLLMLYYKFLGKKVVLTAHNVNTNKRDAKDTRFNRLTLRIQYDLSDHIFVHTEKMKAELVCDYDVPPSRITIVPYGINNAVPRSNLSAAEAKRRLGLGATEKAILFFGRITPYKGLDCLVEAFQQNSDCDDWRLIIAGQLMPGSEEHGHAIEEAIQEDLSRGRILLNRDFIPDNEVEVYFKAADVLALPYRDIYQSGVLFLGYSFGLPVIAADVGSLKQDIVEGETGFVCKPSDPIDLARAIERYFASDLFANLSTQRPKIESYATGRHSWDVAGQLTMSAYTELVRAR